MLSTLTTVSSPAWIKPRGTNHDKLMPFFSPVLSVDPSSLSFAADGKPGEYPIQELTISNAGADRLLLASPPIPQRL